LKNTITLTKYDWLWAVNTFYDGLYIKVILKIRYDFSFNYRYVFFIIIPNLSINKKTQQDFISTDIYSYVSHIFRNSTKKG